LPPVGKELFPILTAATTVATTTIRSLTCPCQNGGICTVIGKEICSCPVGFSGMFCEKSLINKNCQCLNGGTCEENSSTCQCKGGFAGKYCEIEYFRCPANGRFMDQYNCEKGKYFECIHYGQGSIVLICDYR